MFLTLTLSACTPRLMLPVQTSSRISQNRFRKTWDRRATASMLTSQAAQVLYLINSFVNCKDIMQSPVTGAVYTGVTILSYLTSRLLGTRTTFSTTARVLAPQIPPVVLFEQQLSSIGHNTNWLINDYRGRSWSVPHTIFGCHSFIFALFELIFWYCGANWSFFDRLELYVQ